MSKRFWALLGCAVLIFGLFSGCKKKNDLLTGDIYENYTPAGTVYIYFGATLEVIYDDTGMVLRITGTNDAGKRIATGCIDQLGKDCPAAVQVFFRYAIDNKLLDNTKAMVIRAGKDDALPTAAFLKDTTDGCQQISEEKSAGVRVFGLDREQLNEQGELTPETAKALAAYHLGTEESKLTGAETPANGVYTFSFGEKSCTVDAFSGIVTTK